MRLGLDFDNTIVSYDDLFHKVALDGGWIPPDTPVSKNSIRNHLRHMGQEDIWTEMQGYVYGARMAEAAAFAGVRECLVWAREQGIWTFIVSHKTRHPFIGPKYDLHEAARAWLDRHLRDGNGLLVDPDDVFFEITKESKLARVAEIGCSLFIDDLPEILLAPLFPARTQPLLFDPDDHHTTTELPRVRGWIEVRELLEKRWLRVS